MQLFNSKRFIVLFDEIIESFGPGGPEAFYRKGYKKLNLPQEFNENSNGNIGDIQTGAIYSLVWTTNNMASQPPSTALYTRIRFLDA